MTKRRGLAKGRRAVSAIVAVVVGLTGCVFGGDDDRSEPSATTLPADRAEPGDPIVTVAGLDGATTPASRLGLALSNGTPTAAEPETPARVDGDPLTTEQIDALLARLPEWNVSDDRSEFERPPETLQRPDAERLDVPFPPPPTDDTADVPDAGPLEVVRFQPEGRVDIAPFITVTFNQPMVPLTTLGQLDATDVPVSIDPLLDGRWRWVGTRTLRFEVDPDRTDRLPAATRYTIEVPVGTTAESGATLDTAVSWSFETPPPTVLRFGNSRDSLRLDPVFVAVFDQLVDPSAVIDTISLTADGSQQAVRVATADEVDSDPVARRTVARADDGRWVAFRATRDLPADAAIGIVVGPDVPSAEGPLTGTSADTFDARTFGAFAIARSGCGSDPCEPGEPFSIGFNNAIDPASFASDSIVIEPSVPGLRIDVRGDRIELSGATAGRTTHTVEIGGDLRDGFGQRLGDDRTLDWRVGTAPPGLIGPPRQRFTTDPAAEIATVSIQTINHDSVEVHAWSVTPNDFDEFEEYLEQQRSGDEPAEPEWPLVLQETVEIDAADDVWTETAIDLQAAFDQGGSQLIVRIDPTKEFSRDDDAYGRNRPSTTWVQRTDLAVDAFVDTDELLIWTTDLNTGEPVAGVPVELLGDGRTATTDEAGIAALELGETPIVGLWAASGNRTAFLPADRGDGWTARPLADTANWYLFDDRGIYRPGETARLTGWVRRAALSIDAGLELPLPDSELTYEAFDVAGNQIGAGDLELNALGGFNFPIEIPAAANLGPATVTVELAEPSADELSGSSTSHTFQIEEFRRPQFEVDAQVDSAQPQVATQPATVSVSADYFSGGPLPDADVHWVVSTRDATYQPPGWSDFSFGEWQPWWAIDDVGAGRDVLSDDVSSDDVSSDVAEIDECFDCGFDRATIEEFSGSTDSAGTHYLQIDFDHDDIDLPHRVSAAATVFDIDREAWSATTGLLVHPAANYVGVRSDRPFVERGTPIRVDVVATDIDGTTVGGRPISVSAGRVDRAVDGGRWTEVLVDETVCDLTSTNDAIDGSMRCEFPTSIGGRYQITAVVTDVSGDTSRSELSVWVGGGGGGASAARIVEQESVTLVPDADSYQLGEIAQLFVQSPWDHAHGLVTVSHRNIVSTEHFVVEDGSTVLEIPIDDAWAPGIDVQVDLVGATGRAADDGTGLPDAPDRPAFATGSIELPIPPATRELAVLATPAETEVAPGSTTAVNVAVADADGVPVSGANVAVVVVDEAVLSLTDYQLDDPLDAFYPQVRSPLYAQYLRSTLLLDQADPYQAPSAESASHDEAMADDALDESGADLSTPGRSARSSEPIDVRAEFDALAVYAPDRTTGADGSVTVEVPLPDTLTRYRVIAVAVSGTDRFGTAESMIDAQLPLQVRPSAPRFLNYGDRAELPVIVQNQSDQPLTAEVAIEVANLVLDGPAGVRVEVPADDRVEVRFPITTDRVGTARARVLAVSSVGDESFSDAASFALAVYTPATTEAFATYGTLDGDGDGGDGAVVAAAQTVLAPTDVVTAVGGLEVSASSTARQTLTDAVIDLVEYPYDSADGYASRIMAIATLRDILAGFATAALPAPAEIEAQIESDIRALAALQNDEGGFATWRRGSETRPWVSIHATRALVEADLAGYRVPADTLAAALDHVAKIENDVAFDTPPRTRDALVAYALDVLHRAGQPDPARAQLLLDDRGDELELDALAWIWPSIVGAEARADIERRIRNGAVQTAGTTTFATGYTDDDFLIAHSQAKSEAIILDALITQTPDDELIPSVVAGLLGSRTRGRWRNAHENAFALLALDRYFETFEDVEPAFTARVWLDDLYVAESEFAGRTAETATTLVPIDLLTAEPAASADDSADGSADGDAAGDGDPGGDERTLVLAKAGAGRLYYRLALEYAPSDLALPARDEGFVVDRRYEAIDDPDDVIRAADGTWRIAAGATVRVRVTMVADAQRTDVAVVDPLPAGLEAVNPALAGSPISPATPTDGESTPRPWWRHWFEHQNLRDDRVEAFTSFLPGGAYEYTYTARATTPGEFVVPPARAEQIYAPEVFGRSAGDRVVVAD